jgi:hypothetical protein
VANDNRGEASHQMRGFILAKSKLEKRVSEKLKFALSGVTILENKRPDWLISSQGERLELDFYIPELDLAIEAQGQQHYTFTPHFHRDQNGFTGQLKRDREKRYLCERKGITLLEISSISEIDTLIKKIIAILPKKETEEEFVSRMKEYNETHPERIGPMKKTKREVNLSWFSQKKKLRARHFKRFKKKVLALVHTIRTLNKRLGYLCKELNYIYSQSDRTAKERRLINITKSREEQVLTLKKYVKKWHIEIRMAFILSKNWLTPKDKDYLISQYKAYQD